MKGIIFTEFVEMVEKTFGFDMIDTIIDKCDLESGGQYTAVGTYDHGEMAQLVTALSEEVKTPVPDLLKAYGTYLFPRFAVHYPKFFENAKDGLDFLEHVESYIHTEVRKLYPNADLPRFLSDRENEHLLRLTYISNKHLQDVAEGLIVGCLNHFSETAGVEREDVADGVLFTIRRQA